MRYLDYVQTAEEIAAYSGYVDNVGGRQAELDGVPRRMVEMFVLPGLLAMAPGLRYEAGVAGYLEKFMATAGINAQVDDPGCDVQLVFDLIHEQQYAFAFALHLGCMCTRIREPTPMHQFSNMMQILVYKDGLPANEKRVFGADAVGLEVEKSVVHFLTGRMPYLFDAVEHFMSMTAEDRVFDVALRLIMARERPLLQRYILDTAEQDGVVARFFALQVLEKKARHFIGGNRGGSNLDVVYIPAIFEGGVYVVYSEERVYKVHSSPLRDVWTAAERLEIIALFRRLEARYEALAIATAAAHPMCRRAWLFLYENTTVSTVTTANGVVSVEEHNRLWCAGLFYRHVARDHWTRAAHQYGGGLRGQLTYTEMHDAHARELVMHVGRLASRTIATLMLGIQRLEETGVLLLAHQAMFEEMLECLRRADVLE